MVSLQEIVARKRESLESPREPLPEGGREPGEPRGFLEALVRGGPVRVVAEFKRASPSAGVLNRDADAATVARGYEAAGAVAMSVLTERDFFSGCLRDLWDARAACSLPVLLKDFVLERKQVVEARRWGADAVLLIVRILEESELRGLIAEVRSHGMNAVVEAHSEAEVDAAIGAGARIVGINNRDLDTMQVDIRRTEALAGRVPAGVVTVSESGIRSRADLEFVAGCGVDAVLIGEALMRSAEPGRGVKELTG